MLIVNQSFWPDVVATAQQADDLARFLVRRGDEVTVIASRSLYGKKGSRLAPVDSNEGVKIHRVSQNLFDKRGIGTRAIDYLRFNLACMLKALLLPRQDVVICLTTPPFIALTGVLLRLLKGTRFVYWTMDLYPDLPVEAGFIRRNGPLHKVLGAIDVLCLSRADTVVTLGRCMYRRILAKGIAPERVTTIHPWADPTEIFELPARRFEPPVDALGKLRTSTTAPYAQNRFRKEWDIGDRFVIQYSGNFGLGHDADTVCRAMLSTKDDDGIRWVIVGDGIMVPKVVRFVQEHHISNVIIRPYQPRERLNELIALGDVHLVLMVPAFEGVILPSKLFGILAAGRPVIFVGPQESEISHVIQESSCGFVVPNGNSTALLCGIRELRENPTLALALGHRGRKALETRYSMQNACESWYGLLHKEHSPTVSTPNTEAPVNKVSRVRVLDRNESIPAISRALPTHVLTFDIEDWFHIIAIPGLNDDKSWQGFPSIVERYTDLILQELSNRNATATFFVLGWIAQRYPNLVRAIGNEGHEIASHSFWHRPIYSLSPDDFRRDTIDSLKAIEDAIGVRVTGYRAPSFSIVPGTEWAFDVLAESGIQWDSSLFPGERAHGGYPCTPGPHMITSPSGYRLAELPMSTLRIGKRAVGFSGGGYLRLLPKQVIQYGINQGAANGHGTVIYLHPRDFATDCPYAPMPLHRAFRCYWGLDSTLPKFRWLLEDFRFVTCSEALKPLLQTMNTSKER